MKTIANPVKIDKTIGIVTIKNEYVISIAYFFNARAAMSLR
jgi:hypothetical protein